MSSFLKNIIKSELLPNRVKDKLNFVNKPKKESVIQEPKSFTPKNVEVKKEEIIKKPIIPVQEVIKKETPSVPVIEKKIEKPVVKEQVEERSPSLINTDGAFESISEMNNYLNNISQRDFDGITFDNFLTSKESIGNDSTIFSNDYNKFPVIEKPNTSNKKKLDMNVWGFILNK
jgi:hypothetical protein